MERIRLDIIPKGLMPVCHASQYDAGRVIRLDLMDGLQGYSLTDEEIELDVRKPDGHIVTASVDVVAGNTFVDIVTTEQMCAVEGENICELKISKDGAEIYSLNFRMVVEKSVTEGGDPSESFIHNLRTQIAEGVAEEVSTQYDSANVIFDTEPTDNHGIGYTVTSEGIKTAIDNAFDYDNTASGSIVHITDGADNIPVKSLVSQIVAVQDLHGYDKPWVGGAGKNKLEDTFNTGTLLGVDITVDNGVIDLNGTGTDYNSFAIKSRNTSGNYIYMPKGNYIFSAQGIGSGIVVGTTYNGAFYAIARNDNGESVGFSITDNTPSDYKQSDGSVLLALYISISARTYNHKKVYPMIRLATEPDATFEPYENICPITGFDSGVITRCGKNLINLSDVYNATGFVHNRAPIFLKSGTYVLSYDRTTSGDQSFALRKDNTEVFRSNFRANIGRNIVIFTISDEVNNITLYSNVSGTYTNFQIEKGDTATTYEAYNGNTYTFAFGQTVYGGKLNVTTGELTIGGGYDNAQNMSWQKHGASSNNVYYSNSKQSIVKKPQDGHTTVGGLSCSVAEEKAWESLFVSGVSGIAIATTGLVAIALPTITSLEDFNAIANQIQIVYPLATPTTVQLTPTEVKTLLGENNIYSNCGDIEVEYYTNKANDILEFVDSEIGKKNGTNIPIEENSQDSIKTYIDNEVSSINATNLPISSSDTTSTKDYIDNGLSGKVDEGDCVPFELDYPSSITGLVKYANGCYYNPQTNEVHINIVIYSNNNNIPNNNGVIATIPSEYRPSAERVVASFSEILDENNALHFEAIQPIGTSGEIKLHNFVYSGNINTICMNFVYYK